MNILVTGGTGYIGKNLIPRLSSEHNVFITCRNPNIRIANVQVIDISNGYSELYNIKEKIDLVIHLATCFIVKHNYSDIDKLISSNITFGTVLLDWAKDNKVEKIINISTYAQSIDGKSYNPQNLYSASKESFFKIIEYYFMNSDMKFINLEFFDTYGPNDNRPKFVNLLLNALVNNESMFNMSEGKQEICYIYIDDVIDALLYSIDNFNIIASENRIVKYSVSGKDKMKLIDFTHRVLRVCNSRIKLNPGFYPYRENEIMKLNIRYDRIPGWEPKVSIEKGIQKLIEEDDKYESLRN